MKRNIIITAALIALMGAVSLSVAFAGSPLTTQARQERLLANTLRAFGRIDGKRLKPQQVDYLIDLPRCPAVDHDDARILDEDWFYIDADAMVGIWFKGGEEIGTKVVEIAEGF